MRVFIAIPVEENLKKNILSLQRRLDSPDFDIKFVEEDNLHFTIKFFGDIPSKKIEEIKNILKNIAENFNSFEINISGIGCFPNKNYIRVIWLGVKEGYQDFRSLLEYMDSELSKIGFEKEKDYVPHLTLGRVKSVKKPEELSGILAEMENIEIGKMKLNRIILFESILQRTGPMYKELFAAELKE